jgi:Fe-S cluster assembly iron-binding protein IscA
MPDEIGHRTDEKSINNQAASNGILLHWVLCLRIAVNHSMCQVAQPTFETIVRPNESESIYSGCCLMKTMQDSLRVVVDSILLLSGTQRNPISMNRLDTQQLTDTF